TVAGTTTAETITGSSGADVINGGGTAADSIYGGAGNDTFAFNLVTDTLDGGDGSADTLAITSAFSGSVDALITNIEKITVISSTALTVDLTAQTEGFKITASGAGGQSITGSAGADSIVGTAATDTLIGGAGDDTLIGGLGADNLAGGADTDVFVIMPTDTGIDTITDFGYGADSFSGVYTSAGVLKVTMYDSSATALNLATVLASNGTVSITGGSAADTLTGGAGADIFTNLGTGDSVNGGANIDTFTFGSSAVAAATITGGTGADILTGASTAANAITIVDTDGISVTGGSVVDTFTFTKGLIATTVASGTGADSIILGNYANTLTINDGDVSVTGGTGIDAITFTSTTALTAVTVNGSTGVDTVTLPTGATANTITVIDSDGITVAVGSTGVDTVTLGASTTATITGFGGTGGVTSVDVLVVPIGSTANVTMNGTTPTWTASSSTSNVGTTTFTTAANTTTATINLASVANSGTLTINAATASGIATLTGTTSTDSIVGGSGSDSITAGTGMDTITGGAGADTFILAAGANGTTPSSTVFDTITDFGTGADSIDFGATAVTVNLYTTTAAAGTAAISNLGVATFHVDDDTLAERIVATEKAIQLGTAFVAGESALFVYGSDSYIFISDAVAGVDANDVLIKLKDVIGSAVILNLGDIVSVKPYTVAEFTVAAPTLTIANTVYVVDTIANLVAGITTFSSYNSIIDVVQATDTATLAQLATVDAVVSGTLNYEGISDIAANYANAAGAMTANGTAYVKTTHDVTVTDAATIAQLTAIDALTTGTLTYAAVTDALATLVTNAGGYVAGTHAVTVTNTGSVAAADLNTVDGYTSGVINAAAVTTLTGSIAVVTTTYTANSTGTISGLGNEAVTLDDTTATGAALKAIDDATSGIVTASSLTGITASTIAQATALLVTHGLVANG
ncbi:MAG: hypothetical protein PHN45_12545, partial [Methylococcales bacterium]|nr:hypothetical protein [Methylococcales bacterium]